VGGLARGRGLGREKWAECFCLKPRQMADDGKQVARSAESEARKEAELARRFLIGGIYWWKKRKVGAFLPRTLL
jgi:hypothetical protein